MVRSKRCKNDDTYLVSRITWDLIDTFTLRGRARKTNAKSIFRIGELLSAPDCPEHGYSCPTMGIWEGCTPTGQEGSQEGPEQVSAAML